MLDTNTKRRIDTARLMLVGKVPDPKSQVEQITIALIYKFMDDMDAEAEELGGNRKFFAGDYARYGWAKLMRAGLGGHETLNLYAEAITRMPENPGIPPLFRDIFKNAYLPYRDPETLRAFLKIIDEFEYDHSERLGDAFEYLLSVLGSQGDAGQFRTPRHIIDFIVAVLDPKKHETVLDPACGTAGFLISSWKHILQANRDAKGHSTLTPDDKGRMAQNFKGYDISPDMVRLSLVNMYLHGFTDPHIVEYDTLTSQERWNDYADVILANPPFMSPKGGIKPHKRFSVQSKRSEVLFVDYMAEHLTPNGRAGIIVPEGIIFQSQTAYKQLRKLLVEDYLVAVVSLPAGVFQPYSGVKTSILILDKSLAKTSDSVAFFKVEHDGFGLGAQRRAIDRDDLPQVKTELDAYLHALRARASAAELVPSRGLIVAKAKIGANGEYSLSGERYRENGVRQSAFPLRQFEEVCTLEYGASLPKAKRADGPYPVVGSNGITGYHTEYLVEGPAIVVGRKGSAGEVTWIDRNCFPIDTTYYVRPTNPSESDTRYLYRILKTLNLPELRGGAGIPGLNRNDVYDTHKIPLPPLDVQKEIVAEIEGYQKVIDGARAVLDNYRPHIPIHPEWPMVKLKELIDELESGVSVNSTNNPAADGEFGILKTSCVTSGTFDPDEHKSVVPEEHSRLRCPVRANTIIISRMNTESLVGASAFVPRSYPNLFLPDRLWQTVVSRKDVEIRYLQTVLSSKECRHRISSLCGGTSGSMKNISKPQLLSLRIPFPPLATQQAIVAEIEAEQAIVAANRELIARFEQKIQATLARVWGEDAPVTDTSASEPL
ncbi:MAG: N-6 DNA methylase [Rhodocyclaceae bacterium]|nr:N-6 DNA methylase [Rhodocyclaceae bacterium]